MISVEEATQIVLDNFGNFGSEIVPVENAIGRITSSPVHADRDLPPFNRVTMDGIAIRFEDYKNGIRTFRIAGVQYAGSDPLAITEEGSCIEIMTGAALHDTADCIIRYEELIFKDLSAEVTVPPLKRQNIHFKGSDAKKSVPLIEENALIRTPEIAVAASVGSKTISVKKNPAVIIISSGDEIVEIDQIPQPAEIRNSSAYTLSALLKQYGIAASKTHIGDDKTETENQIKQALENFDVVLLCGGVSKGKKDYIPQALEDCGVKKLFHQVSQRPGKPFWFGKKGEIAVFALPGNPVSTFMCARRYFIPWLNKSLEQEPFNSTWAVLSEDYHFVPELSYFLQVKALEEKAQKVAVPVTGGGSGDFSNMLKADGFLEMPLRHSPFYKKGEVFRFWNF